MLSPHSVATSLPTCSCASPQLLLEECVLLPQQLNLPPQQGYLGLTRVVLHCGPVVDVLGAGGIAQRAEGLLNLWVQTTCELPRL